MRRPITTVHLSGMLGIVMLAGCATAPSAPSASDSMLGKPPKAGFGAVYVARPFTMNTSIFPLTIEMDGKPLADLGPSQFTRVDVAPGPHSVTSPNNSYTRMISGTPHPAEFNVQAGHAYYLTPKSWAGTEEYTTMMVIGSVVVPETHKLGHASFSVATLPAASTPPASFEGLSFTPPKAE